MFDGAPYRPCRFTDLRRAQWPAALAAFMVLSGQAWAQTVAPPISIIVSFSPKARTLMMQKDEYLTVSADFYGEPRREKDLPKGDNDGRIHVGGGDETAPFSHYATFNLQGFRLNQAEARKMKPPLKININIFSARHSGQLNYLDCDTFDDDVSVAVQYPIKSTCKLIGE